eukprot:7387823-Pyramimonas_sp.AAC.2
MATALWLHCTPLCTFGIHYHVSAVTEFCEILRTSLRDFHPACVEPSWISRNDKQRRGIIRRIHVAEFVPTTNIASTIIVRDHDYYIITKSCQSSTITRETSDQELSGESVCQSHDTAREATATAVLVCELRP